VSLFLIIRVFSLKINIIYTNTRLDYVLECIESLFELNSIMEIKIKSTIFYFLISNFDKIIIKKYSNKSRRRRAGLYCST